MWECAMESYYDEIDKYYEMENEYYRELEEMEYYESLAKEQFEYTKEVIECEETSQQYYELLENGQLKSHHTTDDFEQLIA